MNTAKNNFKPRPKTESQENRHYKNFVPGFVAWEKIMWKTVKDKRKTHWGPCDKNNDQTADKQEKPRQTQTLDGLKPPWLMPMPVILHCNQETWGNTGTYNSTNTIHKPSCPGWKHKLHKTIRRNKGTKSTNPSRPRKARSTRTQNPTSPSITQPNM